MEEKKVKSILFITSPYHSRRAILTWKKNAPNIKVINFVSEDLLSKGMQWNIGMDKIRVIMYEYFAMVHNWINGRI